MLQGFEAPSAAAPARAAEPGRWQEWRASLGRLLWNPAFAYALALLLAAPVVYRSVLLTPELPPDREAASEAPAARELREYAAAPIALRDVEVPRTAAPPARAEAAPAPPEESAPAPVERFAAARKSRARDTRLAEAEADEGESSDRVAEPAAQVAFAEGAAAPGQLASTPSLAQPGRRLWLELPPGDETVEVRFGLPAPPALAGQARVRILDETRARELREDVALAAGARHVGLDIPAAWLRPGSYRVELWPPGRAEDAPLRYALGVAAR